MHPPGNPSRVHAASKSDVDAGWTWRGCGVDVREGASPPIYFLLYLIYKFIQ